MMSHQIENAIKMFDQIFAKTQEEGAFAKSPTFQCRVALRNALKDPDNFNNGDSFSATDANRIAMAVKFNIDEDIFHDWKHKIIPQMVGFALAITESHDAHAEEFDLSMEEFISLCSEQSYTLARQ